MEILTGAIVLAGVTFVLSVLAFYYLRAPAPERPELKSKIVRDTLFVVGEQNAGIRSFIEYVPPNLPEGSPLLIVLHGSVMDAVSMRSSTGYEFDKLADDRGFVCVYPDGYGHNWNDCRSTATFAAKRKNIDDVGFLKALIDVMKTKHKIDSSSVFVCGFSNGGHMAFRLATETPELCSAVAAISANLPTPDSSSCPQTGATPRVMLINGTADPINPYEGGIVKLFGFASRGKVFSARGTADQFISRNSIESPPLESGSPENVQNSEHTIKRLSWLAGGKPYVVLCTIIGGGHVVPQPAYRFPRLLGKTAANFSAPREIVDFFFAG